MEINNGVISFIVLWIAFVGIGLVLNLSIAQLTCINGVYIILLSIILKIKEILEAKKKVITKAKVVRYIEYNEIIEQEYIKNYFTKINTTTYTAEVEFINTEGKKDYAIYKIATEDKPFNIGEEIEIVYNIKDSTYFLLKSDQEKEIGEVILIVFGSITLLVGLILLYLF